MENLFIKYQRELERLSEREKVLERERKQVRLTEKELQEEKRILREGFKN